MAKIINVVYKLDDKALLKAKTEIQGIEKETKDSEKEMLKLDRAVQKVGNDGAKSFLNFKNILGAISVATVIAGLTQLGSKILDLGIKQEQLNIAFSTFLGSAGKARILLAELTKFAIVTPFTPDQVNQAAKALLAFGVQGKEIIPTLKMLGDVSSGTGKDLTEMAIIFGQIRSTGRLMGQDLLQLINAGFNPLQIISEKTGTSVSKLKEEMEKGNISFQMVADAFKSATSEGGLFFNLMEKQSVSIGGKLSTVAGNIEEVFKNIFSATSGPLAEFVDKLGEISEAFLIMSKTAEQTKNEISDAITTQEIAKFDEFSKGFKTSQEALEAYKEEIKKTKDLIQAEYSLTVVRMTLNQRTFMDSVKGTSRAKKELQKELEETRQRLGAEFNAYENLIPVLEDYIKKTDQVTAAIDRRLFKFKPTVRDAGKDELLDENKDINAKLTEQGREHLVEEMQMFDEFGNLRDLERENQNARELRESLAHQKELEDAEKAHLERRAKLQEAFTNFAIDSIQHVLSASLLSNDEDFSAQQEKFDNELKLAGDNERAKDTIRFRQEQQEKAFRQRQKEDEKQNTIKRILIDTAANVIRSIYNNGGVPLGLPFGALALGAGLLQVATVRKLKHGEVGIDGPGTTTSDSIPAMLSRGESVINADATRGSTGLLEAINNREIDDRILHKIAANGGSQATVFDDSRIIKAIEDNTPDYAAHGYTLMKIQNKRSNLKRIIRNKVQGY